MISEKWKYWSCGFKKYEINNTSAPYIALNTENSTKVLKSLFSRIFFNLNIKTYYDILK